MMAMRRGSFFRQVFLGIMATSALAVLASAFGIERMLERRMVETLAENLLVDARMLAETLDEGALQERVGVLRERFGRRITVIAPDGRVTAESDVPDEAVARIESHATRAEVQQAWREGWGWSTRRSATIDRELLYVAWRDDANRRIVRLALPLGVVEESVARVRGGVVTGMGLGLLLALLVAWLIARRMAAEVNGVAQVALDRAGGARPPFPVTRTEELARLSGALAVMGRELDQRVDDLEAEHHRLQTILDTMNEGVVLCDEQGRIILFNRAAREQFEVEGEVTERTFVETIRVPEVVALAGRMLREREPDSVEFDWRGRSIQASFVPLVEDFQAGFLAVFHDVTVLKRADRIRRDFVANVSHELRTPLASIAGFAESLAEGALEDKAVAVSFVDGIQRNAERLARIIEDLLQLGRIESGRLPLAPEELGVGPAVDAAAQVISTLRTKRHAFVNAVAGDAKVYADRKALSQILVNLIENAAKYCPPESRIEVSADERDGMRRILVRDNGPGIPPQDLPRIFERFYRGDKSRNAAGEPGTGLGLAICKHLATEMGGRIEAESDGRGTTFFLFLPLHPPV